MVIYNTYDICLLSGLLLARIFPYQILSIIPVIYAFVSRPRVRGNPLDRRNYLLLSLIFLAHNSLIIYILCILLDAGCMLRYVFLSPLIPLHFFKRSDRFTVPCDHICLHMIVIRLLWDPPIMLTSSILHKLFKIRLLHDGFNNYITKVTDRLLISSYPFADDVQYLNRVHNVKSVVNMCAEYMGPIGEYSQYGITHLHLPTLDGSVPAIEDLRKGVEFINRRMIDNERKEENVLVHCKGGRGRAAALVLCYLIKYENMKLKDAFDMLFEKRPVLEQSIINYPIYRYFEEKN